MPSTHKRAIELLAPARDAKIAIAAIDHGADAVYMGASSHGARSAAQNSLSDIEYVVNYAHRFNARVYCTVNTLVYDSEISHVEAMIHRLYAIGVDALIVQDLGILKMDIPPIALHASTQCDIRDAEKARMLADAGFSQIVIARELSLEEIRKIHNATDVPLEAFVHGALCVSYSGDCQASYMISGRSANRGECAQICRLPYQLTDKEGKVLHTDCGKHLLSLKDMNRSAFVGQMLEAGISSFKIEGRLKDIGYVKNVVAAYRHILDTHIKAAPDKYYRSSMGVSKISFTPNLNKCFNRGYSDYFLVNRIPDKPLASTKTPKSIGTKVGEVERVAHGGLKAMLSERLNNGDGLGYFNKEGVFTGFRLNRIDGQWLYPASKTDAMPGTVLYRNKDKEWEDRLTGNTAKRTIEVNMTLRKAGATAIAIDIEIPRTGISVSVATTADLSPANTPQHHSHEKILSKLGATNYNLNRLDDKMRGMFVPASQLTSLRRAGIEALDRSISIVHRYQYREGCRLSDKSLSGIETSYHNNISNSLAESFYREHGAMTIKRALEVSPINKKEPIRVMCTRYCLRRELGCCLKTQAGMGLPKELFLRNGNVTLQLRFNCVKCEMEVFTSAMFK